RHAEFCNNAVLQRLRSVFERPTIIEKLCQLSQKQAHIANQEVLVSVVYWPPIRENIAPAYGVLDMEQLADAFCPDQTVQNVFGNNFKILPNCPSGLGDLQ
ncbi:hypothetical protein, partial [Paracoccus yeei]|uniref:hypothetical protein n=1 Tax=Paracoccus yeei TaxID=147645 RepID=UPI001C8D2822